MSSIHIVTMLETVCQSDLYGIYHGDSIVVGTSITDEGIKDLVEHAETLNERCDFEFLVVETITTGVPMECTEQVLYQWDDSQFCRIESPEYFSAIKQIYAFSGGMG